jgi:hypothetical protein
VNLSDPVLEPSTLDLILDLAMPENAFQGDELSFLERLGDLCGRSAVRTGSLQRTDISKGG